MNECARESVTWRVKQRVGRSARETAHALNSVCGANWPLAIARGVSRKLR